VAPYSAWFVPGYCTDDFGKFIMEWFQFFQAMAPRYNRVYWPLNDFTNLDCENTVAGAIGYRAGYLYDPSVITEDTLQPRC